MVGLHVWDADAPLNPFPAEYPRQCLEEQRQQPALESSSWMHDSWKEWWYRVLDLGDPGMIEGLVGFESGSDVVVGW